MMMVVMMMMMMMMIVAAGASPGTRSRTTHIYTTRASQSGQRRRTHVISPTPPLAYKHPRDPLVVDHSR
jgi:hypothetical protein